MASKKNRQSSTTVSEYGMTEEEWEDMMRAAAPKGITGYTSSLDDSIEGGRGSPSRLDELDRAAIINAINQLVRRSDLRNAVKTMYGVSVTAFPDVWYGLAQQTRRLIWLSTAVSARLQWIREVPDEIGLEMLSILTREPPKKEFSCQVSSNQISHEITELHANKPSKTVRLSVPKEELPALWSQIAGNIPQAAVTVARPTRNGIAVTMASTEEADKLRKFAEQSNQLCVAPPKKFKLVLTNFDDQTVSENSLKLALTDKLLRVAKLPSKSVNRGAQLLIELNDRCLAEKLVNEGLRCNPFLLRFRWFVDKPTPKQCYNCQTFGHTAGNCRSSTRCLRCGAGHRVTDCTVDRNAATCCNCNGAHAANSKNCPLRPK